MRTRLWLAGLAFLGLLASFAASPAGDKKETKKKGKKDDGYVTLFGGKSLDGWTVSAKTGHSRTTKNKSGGKWVIEDGAIVGCQDVPGNGGIIVTDKKYKNFEVVLEMNNDYGPDSGLFLRSTMDGKAYQAMIDYHNGGNLMGVYGEGLGGIPHVRNFDFLDDVTKIKENKKTPFALPIKVEDWAKLWKHGQWNELKARIEGNPPHIQTWINGVKFMDFTEKGKARHPDEGHIALQVHGGGDFTKQFVRYRNVRVKVLD